MPHYGPDLKSIEVNRNIPLGFNEYSIGPVCEAENTRESISAVDRNSAKTLYSEEINELLLLLNWFCCIYSTCCCNTPQFSPAEVLIQLSCLPKPHQSVSLALASCPPWHDFPAPSLTPHASGDTSSFLPGLDSPQTPFSNAFIGEYIWVNCSHMCCRNFCAWIWQSLPPGGWQTLEGEPQGWQGHRTLSPPCFS